MMVNYDHDDDDDTEGDDVGDDNGGDDDDAGDDAGDDDGDNDVMLVMMMRVHLQQSTENNAEIFVLIASAQNHSCLKHIVAAQKLSRLFSLCFLFFRENDDDDADDDDDDINSFPSANEALQIK